MSVKPEGVDLQGIVPSVAGRNFLVSGATGRLGSEVIELLIRSGGAVRAVVHPDDPAKHRLADRREVEIIERDLTHRHPPIDRALHGVDAVLHLAAVLPAPGVSSDDVFEGTVTATFHLVTAVLGEQAASRFVFVSSTAVYGPQLTPVMDPVTEDHPIRPTSVYGAAKASAEALLQSFGRSDGLRFTTIRPTDIVNRDDLLSAGGVIGRRLEFGHGVLRVPIDAEGRSSQLSAVTAGHVARCVVAVSCNDDAIGQAYHVGSGVTHTDEEIAHAVASATGRSLDRTLATEGVRRWVIDCRRVSDELGIGSGPSILELLGGIAS